MVLIYETNNGAQKISEKKIFLQVILLNFLDPITSTAITIGVDLTRIGTCETGILFLLSNIFMKCFFRFFLCISSGWTWLV